jgi:hypothetical protein
MYIDPSTGGIIAGVLLTIFGAVSAAIFAYANKIKMFFAKMRRKSDESAEEISEDPIAE